MTLNDCVLGLGTNAGNVIDPGLDKDTVLTTMPLEATRLAMKGPVPPESEVVKVT